MGLSWTIFPRCAHFSLECSNYFSCLSYLYFYLFHFLILIINLMFADFRLRFLKLLGNTFRAMEYKLAMRCSCYSYSHSVLDPKINFTELESGDSTSDGVLTSIKEIFSTIHMKKLEAYTSNLLDYHMVRYFKVVDV